MSDRQAESASTRLGSQSSRRKATRHQPIVSCLECRRMKWKCDRQFPCANCRKRGLESLCPNGQLRSLRGQYEQTSEDIENLKKRNALLKEALEEAVRQGFEISGLGNGLDDISVVDARLTEMVTSATSTERYAQALVGRESSTEESTHGHLIVGDEPGSSSFFGNAGAHYHLHVSGEGSDSPMRGERPFIADDISAERSDTFPFPNLAPITVENLLLLSPSRHDAERWSRIYFDDAAILHHSVDPQIYWANVFPRLFGNANISDQARGQSLNSHELGLVFLVLACGAAMDTSLPPYNEIAERFFRLGRTALSINPGDSLPFIQSIHIMSRYLSNSFKGPKTTLGFWTHLGMAVRSAQSMGLHRDGLRWNLSDEELEMRRRLFWEIYTEDILQSMTQARPRLHHYKYRLARILSKVNDVQVNVVPSQYKDVLAIHDLLKKFEEELPPVLRTNHVIGPHMERSVHYQRMTLRLLIMEGYLFLHRVQFFKALKDSSHEPLTSPFRFSYVAELEASRVILLILQDALAMDDQLACRFLIFFFHAFTAIVNFAAVVIRSPLSSLAKASLIQAEHGVRLFESIPDGFRARNDLPLIRKLLDEARKSIESLNNENRKQSEIDVNSFGFGTKLVRLSTRPLAQAEAIIPSAQNGKSFGLDFNFPTTLADAFEMTNQADPTSEQNCPSEYAVPTFSEDDNNLLDWLSADWTSAFVSSSDQYHAVDQSGSSARVEEDFVNLMTSIGLFASNDQT
ncbi:hypothetical protein V865_001470 [Kwoniella europaea PYCC6329]|uniref:Zn(2)-C6 fungal-type domain-containing protein n=1 Tax=Kwoniella europaea PYCC6329 TaxID=1423913 RepID=A0AAX4KC12_9TREE